MCGLALKTFCMSLLCICYTFDKYKNTQKKSKCKKNIWLAAEVEALFAKTKLYPLLASSKCGRDFRPWLLKVNEDLIFWVSFKKDTMTSKISLKMMFGSIKQNFTPSSQNVTLTTFYATSKTSVDLSAAPAICIT